MKKYAVILVALWSVSVSNFSDRSGGWVTKTPDTARDSMVSDL